jgi:hypothetical protein
MTTPEQPLSARVPTPATAWRISYADVLVAVGGLIIFFFSFAPFVDNSIEFLGEHVGGSQNAWGYVSPLVLFIVLAGMVLVATAAIDVVWPRERQIVGLHRHHVQVGVALYAFVNMVGFALAGVGLSWGGAFLFIGSAIAAAGAILNHFNMLQNSIALPMPKPNTASGAPAGYVPPQGGYAPPAGYVPPQAPAAPAPSDPQVPPGS